MENILLFNLKGEEYIFYKDKLLIKLGKIKNGEIIDIEEDELPEIKKIIDILTENEIDEEKLKELNFKPIEMVEDLKEIYSITIPLTEKKETYFFENCKYLNDFMNNFEVQEEYNEDEIENQEEYNEDEIEDQEEYNEDEIEDQEAYDEDEIENQEAYDEDEIEEQEAYDEDETEEQEEYNEYEIEDQEVYEEDEIDNTAYIYKNKPEEIEQKQEKEQKEQKQDQEQLKTEKPIQHKTHKRRINYKKLIVNLFVIIIALTICIFLIKQAKNKIEKNQYLKQYSYEKTEKKFDTDIKTITITDENEINFYDSFISLYLEDNNFEQLRSDQDTKEEQTNIYENETSRILISKINEKSFDEFLNDLTKVSPEDRAIFEKAKIDNINKLIYNCLLNINNKNQNNKYEIIKSYVLNKYSASVIPYNTESILNKYIVLNGDKTGFVHITDNETTITILNKNTIKIKYNKILTEDEITKLVSSIKYKNN